MGNSRDPVAPFAPVRRSVATNCSHQRLVGCPGSLGSPTLQDFRLGLQFLLGRLGLRLPTDQALAEVWVPKVVLCLVRPGLPIDPLVHLVLVRSLPWAMLR